MKFSLPRGKKLFLVHKTYNLPSGKEDILYTCTYNNISSPNRKAKKLRRCIIILRKFFSPEMDMMKISASFPPWDGRPWSVHWTYIFFISLIPLLLTCCAFDKDLFQIVY